MARNADIPTHLYYQIKHMTVGEYVDLIRELMRVRLDDTIPELTPRIERAADELEATADAAEAALASLGASYDPQIEAVEVTFEANADGVAGTLDSSLGFWGHYLVIEKVLKAKQGDDEETELEDKRELAVRGKAVYEGMFGEGGQEFFRMSYAERFRTLSALLRTLTAEESEVDYAEILQRPFSELIHVIRAKYEHDLAEHLAVRDDSHGLADHRVAMRLALARYAHELREAPDRWSKDSCDRVNVALQPLQDRCQQLAVRH